MSFISVTNSTTFGVSGNIKITLYPTTTFENVLQQLKAGFELPATMPVRIQYFDRDVGTSVNALSVTDLYYAPGMIHPHTPPNKSELACTQLMMKVYNTPPTHDELEHMSQIAMQTAWHALDTTLAADDVTTTWPLPLSPPPSSLPPPPSVPPPPSPPSPIIWPDTTLARRFRPNQPPQPTTPPLPPPLPHLPFSSLNVLKERTAIRKEAATLTGEQQERKFKKADEMREQLNVEGIDVIDRLNVWRRRSDGLCGDIMVDDCYNNGVPSSSYNCLPTHIKNTIQIHVDARADFRRDYNYAKADSIRAFLANTYGVEIHDDEWWWQCTLPTGVDFSGTYLSGNITPSY